MTREYSPPCGSDDRYCHKCARARPESSNEVVTVLKSGSVVSGLEYCGVLNRTTSTKSYRFFPRKPGATVVGGQVAAWNLLFDSKYRNGGR